MRFLTKLYRDNFCSRGKRLLLELFEEKPESNSSVVLEEVCRPGGSATLHKWWKAGHLGFYQRIHLTNIGDQCETAEIHQDLGERFDNIVKIIDIADRPKLKNFTSTLRDGVLYSVAWGDKKKIQHLSIENPEQGSRHLKLIEVLKDNTWSEDKTGKIQL